MPTIMPAPKFRISRARAGAAAALVAAAGSGVARADDWQGYQHDPQHTGRAGLGPVPTSLAPSWNAPANYVSPLIVGNAVLGITRLSPTQVTSFDLADGAVNWTSAAYSGTSREAYAAGTVVFAGSPQGVNASNLYVLDAATGAARYAVPTPYAGNAVTLATDTTTTSQVAYVSCGSNLLAYRLGPTSGTLLWNAPVGTSGSIPAVMGNYAIVDSPQRYYAVNRTTGAVNQFYSGGGNGGGNASPVVDLARDRFFVTDTYGSSTALTAYGLNPATGAVTQLWQKTGSGVGTGGNVALAADGSVYSTGNDVLAQFDGATGNLLRSVTGPFATASAPLLSQGYLWAFGDGGGETNGANTLVYSLADLSLAATFPGTRGDLNTAYRGIGALDDGHLVIDLGGNYGGEGFRVYAGTPVPEPAGAAVGAVAAAGLLTRRRR
ncbi:MAG: outer membrane protein assembly factor BamB, contains PQQ-like beta-propeller repeat, partial [Phycisphaerales bacterium]|nr:outer membrane protein assembly factor BamB, contains PQQ-like beta-propeller repeat [Phycisphaerales bacterium]